MLTISKLVLGNQAKFSSRRLLPITSRARILSSTQLRSKMNLMTISQSLDESFGKHKIIPDVVDKFETQGLLTIEYSENDHVALGNTLKVDKT